MPATSSKAFGRGLRNRLRAVAWIDQWFVAVRRGPVADPANLDLSGLQILLPPKDRFWADPFPMLAPDGQQYIFVEEYLYQNRRGHIAVIALDQNRNVQSCDPVISAEWHLSYPFVLRWRDEVYMVPEAMQSGCIQAYRATDFPHTWKPEAVLLEKAKAVDATLVETDGRWWMFANIAADGAKELREWNAHLHLFYAPTPLGPWTAHARNPVKSDYCGSRPAGGVMTTPRGLYRPAQDCSGRYGGAIILHRIVRLTPTEFEEVAVRRLSPDWAPGLVATHTINTVPGLTVVDGRMRRFRYF